MPGEVDYDCHGLGRRTEKVVGADTTRFVYAGQQCLEEYDGSGDLLRLFVFGDGLDEICMMEAPDVADVDDDANTTELKRFYYHTQLIGSVTHITDPDENVVESYDFGPYGDTLIKDIDETTVSASPIGNPWMFTGRRLDEETGLYYYRARHYSPDLGRFIQRDPLEYVDGPNAFAYVRAAPVSRRDPRGLQELTTWEQEQVESYLEMIAEWRADVERRTAGKKQLGRFRDMEFLPEFVWLKEPPPKPPQGPTPEEQAAAAALQRARDVEAAMNNIARWWERNNPEGRKPPPASPFAPPAVRERVKRNWMVDDARSQNHPDTALMFAELDRLIRERDQYAREAGGGDDD